MVKFSCMLLKKFNILCDKTCIAILQALNDWIEPQLWEISRNDYLLKDYNNYQSISMIWGWRIICHPWYTTYSAVDPADFGLLQEWDKLPAKQSDLFIKSSSFRWLVYQPRRKFIPSWKFRKTRKKLNL